ncbi:TPR-like protein, partial [Piromyces finnis]
MNIDKLQSEVDDFCSFADEYSSKMNEILSGKLTEKDIDNYLNGMDDNTVEKEINNININENKKLSINPQKEAKNIELNTIQKQNMEEKALSKNKNKNKTESKNNNVKTEIKGIDYSKWEHFDDKDSDNEEENNIKSKKNTEQKKEEKKAKWKERVLNEIESHREKGNIYYKKYKFDDAISEYTIAINISKSPSQELVFGTKEFNFMPYKSSYYALPVDFSLYNNRALCYLRLKMYKEAIDDCTDALNLQPDSEKALWRRSTAYQELKDYNMALKDLYKLKNLIENEGNNKNNKAKKESLISIKSIEERIEMYENEFKQYKEDKKILDEISDVNNNSNDISIDFWINRTLKTIKYSKLLKTNKNVENNKDISAESKNCKIAILTLINSFRIYPEMADIFRATDSFKRFSDDSVLCIETFNNIVSIFVEACFNSEKNLNEISKYIHLIITVIVDEFKKCDNLNSKDNTTIKKIPSSLKYSHFCSFMHLLSIGFENKVFFEKAVYNILNPSSLPYLNVF